MLQRLRDVAELLQLRWMSDPWASGRLQQAREDFRAGRITEYKFRSILAMLGYTAYGIDREVGDQLLLLSAP